MSELISSTKFKLEFEFIIEECELIIEEWSKI